MERFYDTPGEPMTRATGTPTSQQSSALDLRPDQQVEVTKPDSIPKPRGLRPRGMDIELLGDHIETKNGYGEKCARPASQLEKALIRRVVELEQVAANLQGQLTRAREQQSEAAAADS